MSKIFLKLFLLMSVCQATLGQQRPQYSQYMMNNFVLNPAIAGIEDYADLKTGYRNQWTGFGGEPTTYYLSGHWALNKADLTSRGITPVRGQKPNIKLTNRFVRVPSHTGLGGLFVSDKAGAFARTTFSLSLAKHIPLQNTMKISLGVSAGITQNSIDFDQITLANPSDPLNQSGKINGYQPELNVGVWLYDRDFYVGASANQVALNNLGFGDILPNQKEYAWQGKSQTHYFLTSGIRRELNEDWAFAPSLMLKYTQGSPVSFDVNAKMYYLDRFWLGTSYRHQDAFVGLLGFHVNSMFNIGYSYDFVFSNINLAARSSHEIVVGIMLNNRQKVVCPVNMW